MLILKKSNGFTLVEMVIVIFVIGVLLLILIPNLTNIGSKSQEKACEANIKLIEMHVESYYLEYREYPDVNDLVGDYLNEEPTCPSQPDSEFIIDKDDGTVQVVTGDEGDVENGEADDSNE